MVIFGLGKKAKDLVSNVAERDRDGLRRVWAEVGQPIDGPGIVRDDDEVA